MASSDLNLGGQYKKLQIDFLTWAASWMRNGTELEPVSCDLPDVVNLLQALGFRIRNVDDKKAQTLSPLRGGENGSKVMISCTYSGQTCVLEQPTKMTNCRCMRPPRHETNDAIWEVTATTPRATQGLVETGCDLIPQMTKEHSSIVKHVINYLVRMIRDKSFGSLGDLSTTPIPFTGRRSEPCGSAALYQNVTPKRNQFLTPSKFDSPTRYRSLDTLTSKDADIGLPEPGCLLPKACDDKPVNPTTVSSPNIKLAVSDTSYSSGSTIEEATISSKAVNLVKNASETLLKALSLMEGQSKKNNSVSPTSAFEDKIISASKNIRKLICTSKPPPSTTSLRHGSSPTLSTKSGLSIPKPKLKIKSDSYSLEVPKAVKPRIRKNSDEKPGIPKPEGVFKKTDKYSHIKSTIPKLIDTTKKSVQG